MKQQILDILNHTEHEPLPSDIYEQLELDPDAPDNEEIYNFIVQNIREREFETIQTLTRREEQLLLRLVKVYLRDLHTAQLEADASTAAKAFIGKDIQEHTTIEEKLLLRMN